MFEALLQSPGGRAMVLLWLIPGAGRLGAALIISLSWRLKCVTFGY